MTTNGADASPLDSRRRSLVRGALALAATAPMCALASTAEAAVPASGAARLGLLNTHTGESIDVVYREGDRYVADAVAAIDHLLRDHRTGEVARIDLRLLDLLARVGMLLDARAPFHVISGYRSPATNAHLAASTTGVARGSLHVRGQAIDVRLPGRTLRQLRAGALSLRAGGVGFYPGSDFVHIDTGRIRRW